MIGRTYTCRLWTASGLMAIALLSTGCKSTFEANVLNDTSSPMTVRMADANWRGESEFLQIARLAPGDTKRIGPVKARGSSVQLQALPSGVATPAATTNLARGETALHIVETERSDGFAGIAWKRIKRPQPEAMRKMQEGSTP